ncbi:MAG: cardiolipin synthase ClsB [Betaproteobacteria bacterium]|nr:cardiolipin synthase ClsB [Betaproteobacteria bacterium]
MRGSSRRWRLAEFKTGNRIHLLVRGAEFFPALVTAIDQAKRDVSLETYIYADDAAGESVTVALERAALRGVSVRLLIDGFGAKDFREDWRARLQAAKASVLAYRPDIAPWTFRTERLRRMHRKIAVIDGCIAFVGGINVIDDLNGVPPDCPRFDLSVRVDGPVVADIYLAVEKLWRRVAWLRLKQRFSQKIQLAPFSIVAESRGEQKAAFVQRDNLRFRRSIEEEYLAAIMRARRDVYIACAYFLPGTRFRRELKAAAERGVRVVLLLQGHTDHRLLQLATRAFYESMLDRGVEICEYSRSELHAKAAVVDGRWATVGSSNLDPLSLVLAREANMVVEDEAFAESLRDAIEAAIKEGATPVRRMLWKHRPWWQRVSIWFGYGVARFAMGLLGMRGF